MAYNGVVLPLDVQCCTRPATRRGLKHWGLEAGESVPVLRYRHLEKQTHWPRLTKFPGRSGDYVVASFIIHENAVKTKKKNKGRKPL